MTGFASPGILGRISRESWWLWLVLGLALGLRLYTAWAWNSWQPDSPARLVGDEPGYDSMAREFLAGYGFTWPGRVPLYPLWLAGVYWIFGASYEVVPYVQALLGVGTVLLTYLLGRRVFGPAAGLVAATAVSVSYVMIHQSLHLLSEALFTPVLVMVAIALWDAFQRPTAGRLVWAGLWTGVSSLVRPTLLFFAVAALVVFAVAWGRRRGPRRALVYGVAVMIAVAPWVIRNYATYDAIFPLQTSNALLWQGSPEYYHLIHDEGYGYMDIWTEVLYGPGWEQHDPTSLEGDRYWTRRALRSIASEPAVYLLYAVEKIGTYWVGDPNA
ncbi:MAG: glycosyltransferase family 39 protein, partial [Actinomycetota bacterium]|nr:glycosyltransferase family 39 protein [Actinomycetota bacterium]